MFKPFSYIMVPIDFSEQSLRALRLADVLARGFEAELHLVHVIEDAADELSAAQGSFSGMPLFFAPTGQVMDQGAIRSETTRRLTELAQQERGGPCTCEVRQGEPVQELLAAAREHDCDVIVICTHGRTGLSHWLLGSVAEKLVRLAPMPVLSVRAQVPGE